MTRARLLMHLGAAGAAIITMLVAPHAEARSAGHLAYVVWHRAGTRWASALEVADGDGRHAHRIPAVEPWAPALSPDGRNVAFSDYALPGDENMTLVISPTGGRGRRVLALGDDWLTEPAWSPDGSQLAYVRQHLVTQAAGAAVYAGVPGLAGSFEYRCSLDVVDLRSGTSRTVAVLGGFAGAWAVAAGGTETPACAHTPAWSPRGDLLAVVGASWAGGWAGPVDQGTYRGTLFTVHPDGSGLTALAPQANGYGLDFSPDGRRILFGWSPTDAQDSGEDLKVIGIDGRGMQVLVSLGKGVDLGYAAWSPDGSRVVAETDLPDGREQLRTFSARTGRTEKVLRSSPALLYESPDWSR